MYQTVQQMDRIIHNFYSETAQDYRRYREQQERAQEQQRPPWVGEYLSADPNNPLHCTKDSTSAK